MKIIIEQEVELEPIMTPNFVTIKGEPRQSIAIQDLEDVTLIKLCNEFTNNLLAKAKERRKKHYA
jgi:hypothetical protein